MRLNNATMKQVIVSPATLGERLRLCSIRPYFEYIGVHLHGNVFWFCW